tara:strand:- start:348 stop:1112 length:765 start_codon:yes stop_codon:yes gene_type:complete
MDTKNEFYGPSKDEIIARHRLLVTAKAEGGKGLTVGFVSGGADDGSYFQKVLNSQKAIGYSDIILSEEQIESLSDDKFMLVEIMKQWDKKKGKGVKTFSFSSDADQASERDTMLLESSPRVHIGNKEMISALLTDEDAVNELIDFVERKYIAQEVLDGDKWQNFDIAEKLFHIIARYPLQDESRLAIIGILFGDRDHLNGGSFAKYKRRKKMSHRKKTRKVRKKGTKKKAPRRRRTRRRKRRRKRRTKRRTRNN